MFTRFRVSLAVLAVTLFACLYGVSACHKDVSTRGPVPAKGFTVPTNPAVTQAVPIWYIDQSNKSGCASDANSGTSATCGAGGQGPIQHWRQLVFLWGTNAPVFGSSVSIVFMSDMTDNTDKIVFKPIVTSGAQVYLIPYPAAPYVGTPCQGTIGTVTAKNRNTPQLLSVVFPSGCGADAGAGILAGSVVQNTTHASYATIKSITATNWVMTQPIDVSNLGFVLGTGQSTSTPAEVDTWASGDSVGVFKFPKVDIAEISPQVSPDDSGISNPVLIVDLNLYDPSGTNGTDVLQVGGNGYVNFANDYIAKSVQFTTTNANGGNEALWSPGLYNCDIAGSLFSGNPNVASQNVNIIGGSIDTGGFLGGGIITGAILDGDVIIGQNTTLSGSQFGCVYVDTSKSILANGSSLTGSSYNSNTAVIWGPGSINVFGGSKFRYAAGATGGATQFKLTGTMKLDDSANAFSTCADNDAGTGAFVTGKTVSAANLDTNAGARSCCLSNGVSSICNF